LQFFSWLSWGTNLLDLGAGSGGLTHWKDWVKPARSDLNLWRRPDRRRTPRAPRGLGCDRPRCCYAERLRRRAHRVLRQPPDRAAGVAGTPRRVARTRAEPGARVYLEWPSPTSIALPTRDELRQHDIEILVSNFRDDPANRTCPDVTTVCGWLREAGFTIVASGAIDLGRFGEELFARAPGQKSPTRSRQSTSPAAACASAL
jgi:hypothetical protein